MNPTKCTCDAVKLLKSLSEYYIDDAIMNWNEAELGEINPRLAKYQQTINLKKHKEHAKELTSKLYNHINRDDKSYPQFNDYLLKESKRYMRGCEEGYGVDCMASLEMLRMLLHEVPEARNKFICSNDIDKKVFSEDDVKDLVNSLFTGDFINSGYHPYKRYIQKELRDECDK